MQTAAARRPPVPTGSRRCMVRSAGAVDRGPLAENLAGAGFMVACMAGFASNDAFMKRSPARFRCSQAVFVRGVDRDGAASGFSPGDRARCGSGRRSATAG